MAYDLTGNSPRASDPPGVPEAESEEGLAEGDGKSSGKTKMAILALLAVVAVAVIGWQFLRPKGPAAAEAQTAAPAAAGGSSEIDAVLQKLASPGGDDAKGFTVGRVEQLVKEFDSYAQHRQVPVKDLRQNPFEVVLDAPAAPKAESAGTKADDPAAVAAKAAAEKAAAEKARVARIREAGGRLSLGSILISGQERLAVINDAVYAKGDVVEGFTVESIEPNRVALKSGEVVVELKLFEPATKRADPKGRS